MLPATVASGTVTDLICVPVCVTAMQSVFILVADVQSFYCHVHSFNVFDTDSDHL